MMPLGAIAARAAGTDDPGAMLGAVGLGAAGAFMLATATLTTNFVNIYMSSLAWKSLMPRASDGAVIWSIGLVGTALSAVPGVWLERYTSFMIVLGGVLVPVGGVLIAHYYIRPPRVDETLIVSSTTPPVRFAACRFPASTAWAAGAAAYFCRAIARRHAAGARGVGRRLPRAAIHSAPMSRLTPVAAAAAFFAGALPRAQPPSRTRSSCSAPARRTRIRIATDRPSRSSSMRRAIWSTSASASSGAPRRRNAPASPPLAAPRLTRAFATHLHSDHTLGLADLILTPWILERPSPLELYGPRGLRAMTHHLVSAYADDLRIRTRGGEPKHGYDPRIVNVHEIAPGFVYRDERVTVTAFAVKHGAWEQAFGYRFQTPDRTIVISGDSGPDSHIEAQCQRCDVLVHEVYSGAGFAKRPPEWQAYHARYHTSARELGAIATRAQPGLLVLYHQLIWSSTEDELLKEVRSAYDGKVVSAHDLDVF